MTKKFPYTEAMDKRTYIDIKHNVACPKCGCITEVFTDVLSYPEAGKQDELYGECSKCEEEVVVPFTIKSIDITLEFD
jgi:hypothetical protein